MRLTEEEIRRHSRTLLLRPVGGRGLEAILATRVLFVGRGSLLDAAALFATRGGLRRAAAPPGDLTIVVEDDLPLADPAFGTPAILAVSGRKGVAIVALETGSHPCAHCRLARARDAAGEREKARGALAVAAGAVLASLAIARNLPEPLGGPRRPALVFLGADAPFPVESRLAGVPACPACSGPAPDAERA